MMDFESQLHGLFRPSVLVVDDSESVRKLICRILSDEGYHTEGVENGQDALAWLDVVMPSLVILDYRLPDMSGKEVVEAMRARQRQVPFVVITGHGDEKVAVEMMKLGASDYLVKDEAFLDLLPSVTRQVIQALSNERLLEESEQELAAKENRFVELFNHIHSGVAVFEAIDAGNDFVFLDVNPALEKIEGVGESELLGQRLSRKAPYLCGEMITALLQRVWRTGRKESREGVPCQGPYGERWLDVQVYRLATGEVVLVYADVTPNMLAEESLAYSHSFEHLIATISSTFVALSPETVGAGFTTALAKLGEFVNADRVVLFRLTSDGETADCIEEWCGPGCARQVEAKRGIRMNELPWVSQKIRQNEVVDVSDLATLPPEAEKEKALWSRFGIKSLLGVPIRASGRVIGYLGVDMFSSERSWNSRDVRLLRTVGEVCGNAMERQSASRRLRKSEERLSLALASSNDGAWEWDRASGEFYLSPRYLDLLAYDPTSFPRNLSALLKILHVDDRRRVVSALKRAIKTGGRFEVECRLVAGNGKESTALVRGRAIDVGRGGTANRLVGTLVDISERKQFEELVFDLARGISSETGDGFFKSLVSHLAGVLGVDFALVGLLQPDDPDCIQTVALYRDGEFLEAVSYRLQGTPCERTVADGGYACKDNVQSLFPQDTLLARCQAHSYVGLPLVDGEGKTFGVLAVLNRKPLDNIPVATSLMQLFASRAAAEFQRQAQEAQLRDSEARYRKLSQEFQTILHGIPDQITLLTPGLDIIWSNRPERDDDMADIFRHCFEVTDGTVEACNSCPAHVCFATGKIQEDLVSRDDRRFGVKFFPLKSDDGEVHSVICMAVDITEKMRLREDAERASRLASLGEVAAGVAHEINNPNALIRINANVLRDLLPELQKVLDRYRDEHGDFPLGKMPYSRLRAEIPKLVREIEHSSSRIRRIVESLREFVSPTFAQEKAVVDLAAIARSAADMVKQIHAKDRIDLGVEARGAPQVFADADSLKQVVVNLLMNAVQSREASPPPISIILDAHRKKGILEVRDQGCGIDPANLEKLTEPFFTTRREEGGTGLGLAICSRIVKEQGGKMEFESEPGFGTTARLVFPVHQEGLVNE